MTIVEAARGITGGVDTHRDAHVVAALDPLGGVLGSASFATDAAGYKALLDWLKEFGDDTKIGVEGTGSYGAGLARYLRRVGSRSSKSTDRTATNGVAAASPIRSMPSKPPGPRSAAERREARSQGTAPSRPSGSSSSPSARPARPGSRRSSRCATSATPPQISCASDSRAARCLRW
jgi:hypothetical protein